MLCSYLLGLQFIVIAIQSCVRLIVPDHWVNMSRTQHTVKILPTEEEDS